MPKVALAQFSGDINKERNVEKAASLAREAAAQVADLDPDRRATPAGLVVVIIENLVDFAVNREIGAVAKLVYVDHRRPLSLSSQV